MRAFMTEMVDRALCMISNVTAAHPSAKYTSHPA